MYWNVKKEQQIFPRHKRSLKMTSAIPVLLSYTMHPRRSFVKSFFQSPTTFDFVLTTLEIVYVKNLLLFFNVPIQKTGPPRVSYIRETLNSTKI